MRWIELIINYSLVIIVITFFFMSFSKLPFYFKILGYTVIISAIVEVFAAYMLFNNKNNLFLFHFLNPFQFLMYSIYLIGILQSGFFRKCIYVLSSFLIVFAFFLSTKIQLINEYNSYWLLIQNFTLSFFLLFYFYEQIISDLQNEEFSKSIFLINIGLFIYCVSNLFIGGFLNTLIKYNVQIALYVYFISAFVSYFTYVCYIFAFRKIAKFESKY
jgi:hypothetical protein